MYAIMPFLGGFGVFDKRDGKRWCRGTMFLFRITVYGCKWIVHREAQFKWSTTVFTFSILERSKTIESGLCLKPTHLHQSIYTSYSVYMYISKTFKKLWGGHGPPLSTQSSAIEWACIFIEGWYCRGVFFSFYSLVCFLCCLGISPFHPK